MDFSLGIECFCSISNGIGGVGMLIPVIPLPEKSQKECSLGKQLIQYLDYNIPLMPCLHQKLSCPKSGVRVGSHYPFLQSNYFSGIVSTHRNLDSHD